MFSIQKRRSAFGAGEKLTHFPRFARHNIKFGDSITRIGVEDEARWNLATFGRSNSMVGKLSRRRRLIILGSITSLLVVVAAVTATLFLTVFKQDASEANGGDGNGIGSPPGSDPSPPSPAPMVGSQSPTTSAFPSIVPSGGPSIGPSSFPSFPSTLTTLCVIADVPYTVDEKKKLPGQISNLASDCEFMIHLGDIKASDGACSEFHYSDMRDMMMLSPVVSFAVLGDNEWNDCPDGGRNKGWNRWNNYLLGMEGNWTHPFQIVRNENRPENFYFVHKGTLFLGLNIVGGNVHSSNEWSSRLGDLYHWTEELVLEHVVEKKQASGIVIMAHALPGSKHTKYFRQLESFILGTLDNEYPFLYLHGDGHKFAYTSDFLGDASMLRIMARGGTDNKPLKIFADPVANGKKPKDAFWFDRQIG